MSNSTSVDAHSPDGIKMLVFETIRRATSSRGTDQVSTKSTFAELGVDMVLCEFIASQLRNALRINITGEALSNLQDVNSLISSVLKLHDCQGSSEAQPVPADVTCQKFEHAKQQALSGFTRSPRDQSVLPLSICLQGNPSLARKTLFLLPDGSGAASSYAQLPALSQDICLYAMNSPILRKPDAEFSIQSATSSWTAEIRRVQPFGPYCLGGWSAGGYWAFEVAKQLIKAGEEVEFIIFIDSPCRLKFEALPMDVIDFLAARGILGNSPGKGPPRWLLDHFEACIDAIEQYAPSPMPASTNCGARSGPKFYLIWAADPVLNESEVLHARVGQGRAVTKFMLDKRKDFGSLGWEKLFPGDRIATAKTPGTHFSLMFPPNVEYVASLLREVLTSSSDVLSHRWMYCT